MSDTRALNLKVVLAAIDKATVPLRAIGRSSQDAAHQLKDTRDQLKKLKEQQAAVEDFRVQQAALKQSSDRLRGMRDRVKELQAAKLQDAASTQSNAKVVDAAIKETSSKIKAMRDRVKELQAAKRDEASSSNANSKEFKAALIESNGALKAMRDRLKQLQAAKLEDAAATRSIAKELKAAQNAVSGATRAYEGQLKAITATKDRLERLGVDKAARAEGALASKIATTNTQLDQQKAKLDQLRVAQDRLRTARAAYDQGQRRAGAFAGAGVATGAVGTAASAPLALSVRDFASLEDAMLQIARQVPGARDETGKLTAIYAQLKAEAHGLGREIPMTTNALAEMMGAGARMEVPLAELKAYTRTAASMAIAFDAVPTEIAEQMGKVGKNFKIPITQIQGLADSINYLDDNAISKGGDIIDVLNRISGVVSTVKMSPQDAAALASTLLTLGERPETAATAINAMTQKLAAATKGTKKFQSAVDEIGLDSKSIQIGMQKDATGTLMSVIESIRKLPQDKRIGVMVELVGMEHSDTLAKLVDKPEELTRQRNLAGSNAAKGSMDRELAARQDTLSARLQITKNRTFELTSALGEQLRPALVSIMQTVNGVLERVVAWTAANPGLPRAILYTVAGLAALLAAAGAVMLGFAAFLGPLAVVRYGLALVSLKAGALGGILRTVGSVGFAALKMVGQGVLFIARALLLNPIGLAITAIATAAYLIYDNWGPIKTWFSELWAGITGIFNSAIDSITTKFNAWFDKIKAGIAWLREAMGGEGQVAVTGAVDVRPPLSAAAVNGRPVQMSIGPTTANIYAAPGMDEKDLLNKFKRMMDERDRDARAKARGSLFDSYYGGAAR